MNRSWILGGTAVIIFAIAHIGFGCGSSDPNAQSPSVPTSQKGRPPGSIVDTQLAAEEDDSVPATKEEGAPDSSNNPKRKAVPTAGAPTVTPRTAPTPTPRNTGPGTPRPPKDVPSKDMP